MELTIAPSRSLPLRSKAIHYFPHWVARSQGRFSLVDGSFVQQFARPARYIFLINSSLPRQHQVFSKIIVRTIQNSKQLIRRYRVLDGCEDSSQTPTLLVCLVEPGDAGAGDLRYQSGSSKFTDGQAQNHSSSTCGLDNVDSYTTSRVVRSEFSEYPYVTTT
jgi:hypothetical protein